MKTDLLEEERQKIIEIVAKDIFIVMANDNTSEKSLQQRAQSAFFRAEIFADELCRQRKKYLDVD